ncbi:MAG TPA: hypothetical protein VFY38_14620 [Pseudonocardia sp.]|nr:hypothetical protein [Pseudonocardia sp.]
MGGAAAVTAWTLRVVGSAVELTADPGDDTDGVWVAFYDPDADNGTGCATVTVDRDQALRFDDVLAATTFLNQTSTVRPTRPDGRPNRPLTAWTIALERVEE